MHAQSLNHAITKSLNEFAFLRVSVSLWQVLGWCHRKLGYAVFQEISNGQFIFSYFRPDTAQLFSLRAGSLQRNTMRQSVSPQSRAQVAVTERWKSHTRIQGRARWQPQGPESAAGRPEDT